VNFNLFFIVSHTSFPAQGQIELYNGKRSKIYNKIFLIVSLFKEHTDIIKRGKSQSAAEFGHKVLFATGATGLITQHEIFRGNPGNNTMLSDILSAHQRHYGEAPHSLSADRRFFSEDNETIAATSGVKKVCICKPGYRSQERRELERQSWFRNLKRLRAGIEGVISTLMRSFLVNTLSMEGLGILPQLCGIKCCDI